MQIAAEASAELVPPSVNASLVADAWLARRFLVSGAHTTRQLIEQSTGTEQPLWIVNWTASSLLSF